MVVVKSIHIPLLFAPLPQIQPPISIVSVEEMEEAFSKMEDVRDEDDEDLGCPSSSSSSSSSDSSNSHDSSSSDFMDDASSSSTTSSSSSSSPTTSSCKDRVEAQAPLFEMSALMEDLPVRRGLSRHFQGKSQSFTSLANAKNLEDLVKPVRASTKKRNIKSCKSYAGGLDAHRPLSPKGITKKPSRGSFSSLVGLRRSGFSVPRPPTHPHSSSSGNLSSQPLLFAR